MTVNINSPTIWGLGPGFFITLLIILIVLGLPLFFISRWILRKIIRSRRKRAVLTWLVTIILTPAICVSIFLLFVYIDTSYPKRDFDQTRWVNNKEERYELSDDIIKSKMLIGKTKAEVRKLLGSEGNKNDSNSWTYILGFRPGVGFPDNDVLEIDFKNNKVTDVTQFQE